jgi:hypothetical protein
MLQILSFYYTLQLYYLGRINNLKIIKFYDQNRIIVKKESKPKDIYKLLNIKNDDVFDVFMINLNSYLK